MTSFTPPSLFGTKHFLKCDHDPFMAVRNGQKRAEIRNNDRNFQLYDRIVLCEYFNGRATGERLTAVITHIQSGYGIMPGYVILSLELL